MFPVDAIKLCEGGEPLLDLVVCARNFDAAVGE